jgi:hypothetical protein
VHDSPAQCDWATSDVDELYDADVSDLYDEIQPHKVANLEAKKQEDPGFAAIFERALRAMQSGVPRHLLPREVREAHMHPATIAAAAVVLARQDKREREYQHAPSHAKVPPPRARGRSRVQASRVRGRTPCHGARRRAMSASSTSSGSDPGGGDPPGGEGEPEPLAAPEPRIVGGLGFLGGCDRLLVDSLSRLAVPR